MISDGGVPVVRAIFIERDEDLRKKSGVPECD